MTLVKSSVKGAPISEAENEANFDHFMDRANHTGTQAVSTLSDVNTGDNLLMAAAERTKLGTVASNADVSPVTSVAGEVGTITAAAMTAALNAFTTSLAGLVPASGGGTTNFLRADGTFAAPPGASGGDAWGDAVDADVVPDADGTRDLGTAVNRFAELHVDSIDLNGTTLDGTVLADPGADRMLFWDDSASTTAYLVANTGLAISGTSLNAEVALSNSVTLTNKSLTDPKVAVTANAQSGTTYTLVLTDASKFVTLGNGTSNAVTIPPNSSVAFPVGTVIAFQLIGAGTGTIEGGAGVTLNGVSTGTGTLSAQWAGASIIKTATDTWSIIGDVGTVA